MFLVDYVCIYLWSVKVCSQCCSDIEPGVVDGWYVLGLSDTTVLAIYRDIFKVSISQYFVINYRDTMPVHYCH